MRYEEYSREEGSNKVSRLIKRGVFTAVGTVVGLTLWAVFTVNIPQGHEGVVFNKQHGVEKQTLSQGTKFINPLERITAYPVSTETVKQTLKVSTKDGKPLKVEVTYDYHNESAKLPHIYDKFKGQEAKLIEQGWLQSRLKKSANSVTSQHTVLDVFQKTDAISLDIEKAFQDNVDKDGFIIESVTFGTPEPDENTQLAIQAVVNAQQDVEKLKIDKQKKELEAQQKKIEAEGEAEKKRIEAEAEAKATKIKADAEADANKTIQATITPDILKKMEMEARKSHGWVTIQGASVLAEQN
jgi:prohibitin 1